MRLIRIFFRKEGKMKYISHLDLMRAMQRAVRRSGIKAKYSEGFNPHMQTVFALPLSLGMESVCECMDLKVEDGEVPETFPEKLNAVLPDGINVFRAAEPVMKINAIRLAEYELHLFFEDDCAEKAQAIRERLKGDELIAVKESKKSTRVLNLMEFIKTIDVSSTDEYVKIVVTLPAGSQENINPSLLAQAVCGGIHVITPHVSILRRRLMTEASEDFC